MKKKLRAGLVGSGFSASFQVEALRRVYGVDVEITGVYSRDRERCGAFAAKRSLAAHDSFEALLEGADVIHLCSPPATHEPLAIRTLQAGKHVIIEKPFTGYFGDGTDGFDGRTFPREIAVKEAMASVDRLLRAENESAGRIIYAENWVYAPAIQKEREVIEKTGAQILWIHGEESHSGSHASYYGHWRLAGGGSLMGKGVHPLTASLYMKKVEGRVHAGSAIRPVRVSCRTHAITRMDNYRDAGQLRADYEDVEDFSFAHIEFQDGTVADIYANELVLGGTHNWLEVAANNHRTICNINPNTSLQTYNPIGKQFDDIYVVEKIGTKEGWAFTSPEEDWFTGYFQETEAFYRTAAYGDELESDSILAADTIATVYAAYLSAEREGAAVDIPLVSAAGAGSS